MKSVLITGATGAIGSALVPLFLAEPETRLRLLVRAKDAAHLRERARELLRYWNLDPEEPRHAEVLGRLEFLRGDACARDLGLEDSVWKRLSNEVTHIVHSAGNVRLNQSIEEARAHALTSIQEITALARRAQAAGMLQKVDYVSTVGVAGRTRGLIPEERLTHVRAFHNTYEAAKAEAEAWLLQEMDRGLPATIHRPSMVVGDSRTGRIIHFQVFYYLAEWLSGKKTWGFIPHAPQARLDLVPVDYVARALYRSSGLEETAGRIFHLCSGPTHAAGLMDLARRVREILTEGGERLPPLRTIRPAFLRTGVSLASTVAPPKLRRALKSLPNLLEYLDADQLFDDRQSRAFFGSAGFSVPPVETYLKSLLTYYHATA